MQEERKGSRLMRAMPGLGALRGYDVKDIGPDFLAGFVMVLVLIPSVMAYAEFARASGDASRRWASAKSGVTTEPAPMRITMSK